MRRTISQRAGFSLIELLVVMGIIAILIGIMLPTLQRVRQHSRQIVCQSNMRQTGQLLLMYANTYNGWIFPLGPDAQPRLGVWVPREQRWPIHVKGIERWDHPLLLCPNDEDPVEKHSYALNWHFQRHSVRFSTTNIGGLKPAEAILMGEKRDSANNYFIGDEGDYTYAAEEYKHGLTRGSNYLFMDLHVSTMEAKFGRRGYDPWNENQ